MEFNIKQANETKQQVESIIIDEVGKVVNRIFTKGDLSYPDSIRLRNSIEKQDSVFSSKEIAWMLYNHHLWLYLIKAPVGRKVFLDLFRYADNVYRMARRVNTTRRSVYKWINRLKECTWVFIDTQMPGNEVLYVLNKRQFPTLMFLTRWFIHECIARENQTKKYDLRVTA